MLPGGIQDEDGISKHKHKEVCKPKRVMASRGLYNKLWRRSKPSVHRELSQNKIAVRMRRRRAGILSIKRRQQLERLLFTIYKETAWMKGVLLKVTDSAYFDDAFVANIARLCDTLVKDVAFEIVKYNEKNKVVDTSTLKQRALDKLVEARQQFRLLQKVVSL